MIEISNLHIERNVEGYARAVVDITSDEERKDNEKFMWIGVKDENANMLTTDVYNAYLFLPLYMAMYYHTDLRIHGCVSKRLYKSIMNYLQPILCSFLTKLSRVNVIVDGFKENEGDHNLIGTGISCGVDSLSTIYKYYIEESDNEYKINSLFMLNCGWHGVFYDPNTRVIFEKRCDENKKAADAMGLDFYCVDSNLHCFLPFLDDQASYFSLYTSIFALEKSISKYYLASSFSYGEVMDYGNKAHMKDFSEYADSMALPLMESNNLRLISDGCQYKRSQKLEHIVDWEISKKYLNVCSNNESKENCCLCVKCLRTLLPLEALDKLEEYKDVFDIEKYRKEAFNEKCRLVLSYKKHGFSKDNYDFCVEHGMKLPSYFEARLHFLPKYIGRIFKR